MRQCARFVVDFLLVRHFYFFLKKDDVVSDLTKMARIHLWIFMSINRRDAINSNATTWKTVIVAVLSTAMFVSHCNQFRLVISANDSSSFVFSSSCFSSFHRIVRLTFDWRCQEWVNTSHKMLQSKLNYSCRFPSNASNLFSFVTLRTEECATSRAHHTGMTFLFSFIGMRFSKQFWIALPQLIVWWWHLLPNLSCTRVTHCD